MRVTIALAVALWAGTAAAQYPYAVPPAWGYMNKAEALRQQQFENQLRWQQEQRAQWNYWFGEDSLSYGKRAVELRVLKQQERNLRLQNERLEQANPFHPSNNPFDPSNNPFR